MRAYPRIEDWLTAPLPERIGRVCSKAHGAAGEGRLAEEMTSRTCYKARSYIIFLTAVGLVPLDREWLMTVPRLHVWRYFKHAGNGDLVAGLEELATEAQMLGYTERSAWSSLTWSLSRIYMHTLNPNVSSIGEREIDELENTFRSFADREDRDLYFGSEEGYWRSLKDRGVHLHVLRVVLYHRGQIETEPRKRWTTRRERPTLKPQMQESMERYLTARRLIDRPDTVGKTERGIRLFAEWLEEAYPEVESFAQIERDHVLDFAEALLEMPSKTTGQPLALKTRHERLRTLMVFFRDTADWGWENMPGRPLLSDGDIPKRTESVPRYIPEHELARLMEAVIEIECPYQRAALLIARWSGARRDEIRRLEVDCLDAYPDGTPRLRIPAGKTKKERIIPLNEEAAEAIRQLQKDRSGESTRGFRDDLTGLVTRRLFMHHGKSFSSLYLFESSLKKACSAAGLMDEEGKPTVTAHRFRHTVGTQMAERGARLNTIMKVLGHQSAGMSMIYARISDEEVLKDYKAVLGPGAIIAGPLAETLRSGELPQSEVDWIKHNFFENELELGYCLRLPQEGPCECDLFLNCAKFVTTADYAPRLRARRQREFELIESAISNGWQREAERHRCTVRRIEQLLDDLGEPLEEE